uniref:GRANULINS domain-containing protein n=1 Tax=Heterorhabditis bacteriophora TaxID=37862 RepID=A0A1I7WVN4_HETBA
MPCAVMIAFTVALMVPDVIHKEVAASKNKIITALKLDIISPLRKKVRAQKKNEHNEIICPDRRSKCPSGTTCCFMRQGQYGCCPVEEAVCCMDQLHCCPKNYVCDSTGQRCINMEVIFCKSLFFLDGFSTTIFDYVAVCCKESCCPSGYHCRPDGKCEKHARRNLFID